MAYCSNFIASTCCRSVVQPVLKRKIHNKSTTDGNSLNMYRRQMDDGFMEVYNALDNVSSQIDGLELSTSAVHRNIPYHLFRQVINSAFSSQRSWMNKMLHNRVFEKTVYYSQPDNVMPPYGGIPWRDVMWCHLSVCLSHSLGGSTVCPRPTAVVGVSLIDLRVSPRVTLLSTSGSDEAIVLCVCMHENFWLKWYLT